MLRVGGFPEPFLQNDDTFYRRRKRRHTDTILHQDLLDFKFVIDIGYQGPPPVGLAYTAAALQRELYHLRFYSIPNGASQSQESSI